MRSSIGERSHILLHVTLPVTCQSKITHDKQESMVYWQLTDDSLILHIWPGRWNLPSVDPHCLAAVLYLQLAIPNKFSITECCNPDLSPTGQLPYLVHENHTISTLPSIIKYVSGLRPPRSSRDDNSQDHLECDLDAHLSQVQRSQRVAWVAHVESNLGDLVAHTFYSLRENWVDLTHPALVSMLSIPQRYYVPSRIRQSYQPRLEAAGLWNLPGIEQPERQPSKREIDILRKDKFIRVFEREKVLEKARSALDKYSGLLGDKPFIYHSRPTTLDTILAAHILLLLEPPFPDPLLQSLLKESYPPLVNHARLIQVRASSSFPSIKTLPPSSSLRSLIPAWPNSGVRDKIQEKTAEDMSFDRLRWGWMAIATIAAAMYLVNTGLRIRFVVDEGGRHVSDNEDVQTVQESEEEELEADEEENETAADP